MIDRTRCPTTERKCTLRMPSWTAKVDPDTGNLIIKAYKRTVDDRVFELGFAFALPASEYGPKKLYELAENINGLNRYMLTERVPDHVRVELENRKDD